VIGHGEPAVRQEPGDERGVAVLHPDDVDGEQHLVEINGRGHHQQQHARVQPAFSRLRPPAHQADHSRQHDDRRKHHSRILPATQIKALRFGAASGAYCEDARPATPGVVALDPAEFLDSLASQGVRYQLPQAARLAR
jgi:hypothetical protein